MPGPRGFPAVPLPTGEGGMWLPERGRPPGAVRFMRNYHPDQMAVRPGSQYSVQSGQLLTPIALETLTWAPGGAFAYRTVFGSHYILALGFLSLGGAPSNAQLVVLQGLRNLQAGGSAVRANVALGVGTTALQIPATWAALGDHALVAGPLEGEIGHFEVRSDGTIEIGTLTAIDRVVDPLAPVDPNGAPYLLKPPRTLSIFMHQDRWMCVTPEGFLRWSNLRDPRGWQVNNFVRVSGAGITIGRDEVVAGTSMGTNRAVLFTRDQAWEITGNIMELRGRHIEPSPFRQGPVSPACLQVAEGVVFGLGENGVFRYPGGIVAGIEPLFRAFADVSLDLEIYRPTPAALSGAISRYDRSRNVIEWAVGADLNDGSAEEERRLRICHEPRLGRTWIEVHPPTTAFAAVDDEHEETLLIRLSRAGRLFIEGVGDFDQDFPESQAVDLPIDAELVMPPLDFSPENIRLRDIHLLMDRRWRSVVTIGITAEHRSREQEQITTTRGEDRADQAFASSGSAASGFVLGTTTLPIDEERARHHGFPLGAIGQRLHIRLSTTAGGIAGHRWGVKRLHVQPTATRRVINV